MYEGYDMVEKTAIQEKITTIVADQLEKNADVLNAIDALVDQGADELDCIEIIMRLEEAFGLEINDADAEQLLSIQDMVNYIFSRSKE